MSDSRKIGPKLAGFPRFGPKRMEKGKKKGEKEYRIRHKRTLGIEQGISNDEVRNAGSLPTGSLSTTYRDSDSGGQSKTDEIASAYKAGLAMTFYFGFGAHSAALRMTIPKVRLRLAPVVSLLVNKNDGGASRTIVYYISGDILIHSVLRLLASQCKNFFPGTD